MVEKTVKVRYTGDYYKISLVKGRIYDVISVDDGWYRIVDETGEDYLFSTDQFETVQKTA